MSIVAMFQCSCSQFMVQPLMFVSFNYFQEEVVTATFTLTTNTRTESTSSATSAKDEDNDDNTQVKSRTMEIQTPIVLCVEECLSHPQGCHIYEYSLCTEIFIEEYFYYTTTLNFKYGHLLIILCIKLTQHPTQVSQEKWNSSLFVPLCFEECLKTP